MNATVLSWATWLANTLLFGYEKVSSVCSDVWRLYKEDHLWFISDSGYFADSCYMTVNDKSGFWVFDGSTIVHSESSATRKRMPYLSAEMRSGESLVSLDTFLEEVRYSADVDIPFPVLMAAFMIHSKCLYDWRKYNFKVILRNGDEKEFIGMPE